MASSSHNEMLQFWHSGLRDNCESAYAYVFHVHLTCVMTIPGKTFQMFYFCDNQNSRAPNSKISASTTQNITKCAKIDHREPRHKQRNGNTDGCDNSRIVQLSACDYQFLFQFYEASLKLNVSGKGITQASLELQLQLCPESTQE